MLGRDLLSQKLNSVVPTRLGKFIGRVGLIIFGLGRHDNLIKEIKKKLNRL